jgi:hypothetical protein
MTELAAGAIALMLDLRWRSHVWCVAAWFELRQASEERSAKQADVGGAATAQSSPEPPPGVRPLVATA